MLSIKSIIITGLLSVFSMNALASTKVFITSIPSDREIIVIPRGYATCRIIPITYKHGVWTNQYKVCHYPRGIWTAGHWQCVNLKHHTNICLQWNWVPSRWEGAHATVYNTPRSSSQPVIYAAPPVMAQPAPIPVHSVAPQPVIVSYNN